MDRATNIIGVTITSIVVIITFITGILYYFIMYHHFKQKKHVRSDTHISPTIKEEKISTTSF
ncbi:hypothetical protein I4U23_029120 [Adineta vaga]|nr:hypothetical protein I4U23_029120 [Adineta vaga]